MSSYVHLDFKWVDPDPLIVAKRMFWIDDQLKDLVEPMTIAAELTRSDVQENFDTQTDPDGVPWDEWAESYVPYALAFGSGQILNLTGELKSAATSIEAFVPTNDGLFINTGGFPEYWAWNNFGAVRAAGGQGNDVSEEDVRTRAKQILTREFRAGNKISATTALHQAAAEFTMGGGDNELPPRPFIGLSTEAKAKLDAAFALWFEGSIALGSSSKGKAFGRHTKRGPGGRFVKRA